MKVRLYSVLAVVIVSFVAPATLLAQKAHPARLFTKAELEKTLPASVFLDGQNFPTQTRNAVAAQMADGKTLVVALLDTAGYSSEYQEKYVGALLTQGPLQFGKHELGPGAYGLGKKKSVVAGKESMSFVLYDLGGNAVAEAPSEKDGKLRPALPVQLKLESGAGARLYLGRDFVVVSSR